jgi:hypothetical protein
MPSLSIVKCLCIAAASTLLEDECAMNAAINAAAEPDDLRSQRVRETAILGALRGRHERTL